MFIIINQLLTLRGCCHSYPRVQRPLSTGNELNRLVPINETNSFMFVDFLACFPPVYIREVYLHQQCSMLVCEPCREREKKFTWSATE